MTNERDFEQMFRQQQQLERQIRTMSAADGRTYVEKLIAKSEVDTLVGQAALANVRVSRTFTPVLNQVAREAGLIKE